MDSTPLDQMRTPLICLLEELAGVLRSLTDEQYAHKLPQVFNSSIGGHVRHALDHVNAWLDGLADGELNYDQRERGTMVETNRGAALINIEHLITRLKRLPDTPPRPMTLRVMLSVDAPTLQTTTTAGREVAFVISHTVHHNAIISVMVQMQGGQLPTNFGYAPSTLAYLKDQAR